MPHTAYWYNHRVEPVSENDKMKGLELIIKETTWVKISYITIPGDARVKKRY